MTREPTFGVPKDAEHLTTQDPCAVAYGVTPSNEFIPLKIDSSGRLEIAAEVTLDAGDLEIGAVEIKNYNTDDRAYVSPDHEVLAQARVYDAAGTGITSTNVLGKQGLDVNFITGLTSEDNSVPAGMDVLAVANLVYGYDGIDWERIKSSSNRLVVDGSQVTQPISAVSLPLPTGAATEATLATRATEATLSGFRTDFNATDFATETTLALIKTNTDSLDVNLSTRASEATLSSVDTKLTDASQKTQIVDGLGNVISSTTNALDVNIKSGVTLDVNLDNANDDVLVYGFDGTTNQKIKTNVAGELSVNVLSSALPTGAATEATLATRASEATLSGFRTDFNAVDFATETTLAGIKAQTDLLTFTGTRLQVDASISGGVTDLEDNSIAAGQTLPLGIQLPYGYNGATWERLRSSAGRLLIDGSGVTQPISAVSLPLPTGAATEATLATRLADATFTARINTLGQKTMANSTPVVIASDQTVIPVSDNGGSLTVDGTVTSVPQTSTTPVTTQVARSNASQTLLALNVNRKGATLYNDAAANLFIKLGTTASSADFTVRLQNNDYYEVPFNYTGRIDGIWASNGAGDVKITELT